jgi:hypothetical protein
MCPLARPFGLRIRRRLCYARFGFAKRDATIKSTRRIKMRVLSKTEVKSVGGGYSCSGFLFYLLTSTICCEGKCYEY